MQDQLNNQLEEKGRDVQQNKNDINFLMCCGATKKEALKKSIEKENFATFKYFVEEDKNLLYELKKLKYWKELIQNLFDKWIDFELYKGNFTDNNCRINWIKKYLDLEEQNKLNNKIKNRKIKIKDINAQKIYNTVETNPKTYDEYLHLDD